MADVFISQLGVPKKFRNGRIYGGNSFDVTNRYEAGEIGGGSVHREFATLIGDTDITDRNVEISFSEEFNAEPVGWFEIYRMVARGVEYVKQDVLHSHTNEEWLTTTGFQLTIHSSESLTGVKLKYYYTE